MIPVCGALCWGEIQCCQQKEKVNDKKESFLQISDWFSQKKNCKFLHKKMMTEILLGKWMDKEGNSLQHYHAQTI